VAPAQTGAPQMLLPGIFFSHPAKPLATRQITGSECYNCRISVQKLPYSSLKQDFIADYDN
jgi:hypothetical protein